MLNEEDHILVKNLYYQKGYGTRTSVKEFPAKTWKNVPSRALHMDRNSSSSLTCLHRGSSPSALCGLQGCKNRALHFLSGCHKRRLNQALSIVVLV